MEIEYKFFPEEKLFVYRALESFSVKEWKSFYKTILVRKEWQSVKNVLVDLRQSYDLINVIDEIEEVIRFRKDIIQKNYRTVFLVDDPEATVFSDIYVGEISNDFVCYYCSTVEHANKLFGFFKSEPDFAGMIKILDEFYKA